jgi:hypothetical protein
LRRLISIAFFDIGAPWMARCGDDSADCYYGANLAQCREQNRCLGDARSRLESESGAA